MKTHKLDLTDYEVDVDKIVEVDGKKAVQKVKETLSIKKELSEILRLPGIYSNGVESFDGLMLGRQIRACEEDTLQISEVELEVLRKVLDKLISRPHDPSKGSIALGGVRYEELIIRVFGL